MDAEKKKSDDCCKNDQSKYNDLFVKIKKNPVVALGVLFGVVAVVNIAVLSVFSVTVNSKLNQAIAANKPIEAEMTLVIPADCPSCGDLSAYKKQILTQNIELSEDVIFSSESEKGKALIEEYSLQNLPALILATKDVTEKKIFTNLPEGSKQQGENVLVWEQHMPPYYSTQSKRVEGLVSLTYLTDKSCKDCYDAAAVHRPIMQNFGVAVVSENSVDVNSEAGQSLKKTYNIESVPTVILSPEASKYEALNGVWLRVGSVEVDGSYVFRDLSQLQGITYKDLTNNKVIAPSVQ